jgi:hypothetical protein
VAVRLPSLVAACALCVWATHFVACGGASYTPPAKDFGMAISPGTITADAGGADSAFTVSITGQNGFADSVSIALSGLPDGATASPAGPFSVAAGGGQTVTLSIPSTISAGTFTVMANGTSGSLTHASSLALTVQSAKDFSISASSTTGMLVQ